MRSIRARLRVATGDEGMTLVEVMIAMFVFAILSTMVLSSLLQIVTVNRSSDAQHVAANLAAAEVELAHDTTDLFALIDGIRSVVVNGMNFTVTRDTGWVNETADAAACGAGGGSLRFKRVNVTVTWDGMPESMAPVRADTLVDPVQRLNDPAKGTVLVSIRDAQGNGVAGATVALTPTADGAATPSRTTDAEGCVYFLQVTRGTYEVSVSKTGYIGVTLDPTPRQRDVSVAAGTTSSIGFQYDEQARLSVRLAQGAGTVRLPRNLPLTLISTYGVTPVPLTGSTPVTLNSTTSVPVNVHPRVTYRLFVGNYGRETGADCTSADPIAWPESPDLGLAAGIAPEVGAEPGGTASVDVAMGFVRLGARASDLRATPAPGVDTPVCAATFVHTFGDVANGSTIALPFGTWRLTNGANGAVVATVVSRGSVVGSTVTLDPREESDDDDDDDD